VPAISSNSKYHGLGIAALVKELERRDTDEAKANAGPKELSAKDKRRKRKEQEDAEREKRRHEEAMTAEERQESDQEKFARKMQQQRLVEDADLELAMELMGGCELPFPRRPASPCFAHSSSAAPGLTGVFGSVLVSAACFFFFFFLRVVYSSACTPGLGSVQVTIPMRRKTR
jgi:hypothetical protein